MDAVTVKLKSAWIKFRELLPILTNNSISPKSRGSVFSAGVYGVLLHTSDTWALTDADKMRLTRNNNAMVCWICSSRLSDRTQTANLRSFLQHTLFGCDFASRKIEMVWAYQEDG